MRQIVLPLLLMVMVSATTQAATIYKWVDANGVTHYSDQPFPGAKKIEVESAQTYAAPSPEKGTVPQAAKKKASDGPLYAACDVYKPSAEEALINVQSVTAKVRLNPGLRAGDRALIAFDGKVLADVEMVGSEFTISPVYRGEHTVSAVVQNLAGNIVCQSDPIKFYVREASKLSPQSPLRPKPPAKPPKKP